MSDKPSFVLYLDLLSAIDEMDDEQTARLFRLIKAYNELESEDEQVQAAAKALYDELIADPVLRIIFAPFRKRFEADRKRYAAIVAANRENGRKGGAPKGNSNARRKTQPEATGEGLNSEVETTETTDRLKKQPKTSDTTETSQTSRYNMICNDNNIIPSNEEIIDKEKIEKEKPEKTKKEKIAFASSVKLTQDEYNAFVEQYGEQATKELIQILNDYKEANDKKYKSDAAAIRSWVVDRYLQKQKPTTANYGQSAAAPRPQTGTRPIPSTVEGTPQQPPRRFKGTL